MRNMRYVIPGIVLLQAFFLSCNSSSTPSNTPKAIAAPEVASEHATPAPVAKKSAYAGLLMKFKPIAFDTLKVTYHYGTKDKRYQGTELTLAEAKLFPLGITENYFGKMSGVYGCYQFPIDSAHTGLIARIPGEYDANSMGLFILDHQKDRLQEAYFSLSISFGDAGDAYERTSWLIKAKGNQYQALVYDYSSYNHQVEDTTDHTIDEWHAYYLFNCMTPGFDTISKNEIRLKKQFKNLLNVEK